MFVCQTSSEESCFLLVSILRRTTGNTTSHRTTNIPRTRGTPSKGYWPGESERQKDWYDPVRAVTKILCLVGGGGGGVADSAHPSTGVFCI